MLIDNDLVHRCVGYDCEDYCDTASQNRWIGCKYSLECGDAQDYYRMDGTVYPHINGECSGIKDSPGRERTFPKMIRKILREQGYLDQEHQDTWWDKIVSLVKRRGQG